MPDPPQQQRETILLVIIATALLLGLALFIIMFVRAYLRTRQKLIHENTLQAERFQRALLETRLEIQEETTRHIGRELHDNIGQIASLMKANLAVMQIKHPGPVAQNLEETMDLLRALIGDVKSMSVNLNGANLKHNDLPQALHSLAHAATRSSGRQVDFVNTGGVRPQLDVNRATILYRIVQEAVSNAVKHSGATHIGIALERAGGGVVLRITDDGAGFDPTAARPEAGSGLGNMHDRAALLGATLTVESAKGRGAIVTLALPDKPAPHHAAHPTI